MLKRLLLILLLILVRPVIAADGGYLMVTFKDGPDPSAEQIYFLTSGDGQNWTALGQNEPALVSHVGEQGVRDPFLLRSQDGKRFFLLATDLSMNRNGDWKRAVRAGSKSLVIWESTDLVKWSEPRLVKVAPDDAGCAWAPEAIFDKQAKNYLVYWSSTTGRDRFARQRIWSARTTDFKTFSKPEIFIEKSFSVIDTTIVQENGHYFRFSKNESARSIFVETGERLTGPWKEIAGFSLAKQTGYEGPALFPLGTAEAGKPGKWCLLLDQYAQGGGYQPFTTDDLTAGQFARAGEIRFPYKPRHGAVIRLSADELTRIQQAYQAPAGSADRP